MGECLQHLKVGKTVKIGSFNHKEWLGICAIFFEVGVDEMTRNTSCFVILFHVNN